MKYFFISCLLFLSSCGGAKVRIHDGPCDPIPSREREFVCAGDVVVSECKFVPEHTVSVCREK